MVDKRTEAGPKKPDAPDYGAMIARGVTGASSAVGAAAEATAAFAWNPPTAVAASVASMFAGALNQGNTEPAATVIDPEKMREAAEFAEAKAQLRNLIADAERTISGMMPGPMKTAAQGVLASAANAMPQSIQAAINAIKDLIADARTKELGDDALAVRREQLEAERERLRIEWQDIKNDIHDMIDATENKTDAEKKAAKDTIDKLMEKMDKREDRIAELTRIIADPETDAATRAEAEARRDKLVDKQATETAKLGDEVTSFTGDQRKGDAIETQTTQLWQDRRAFTEREIQAESAKAATQVAPAEQKEKTVAATNLTVDKASLGTFSPATSPNTLDPSKQVAPSTNFG